MKGFAYSKTDFKKLYEQPSWVGIKKNPEETYKEIMKQVHKLENSICILFSPSWKGSLTLRQTLRRVCEQSSYVGIEKILQKTNYETVS